MTRLVLFRDFAEDRRFSMERYADRLAAALAPELPADWQLEAYRPHLPKALGAAPLGALGRLRLARYLAYPWQARGRHAALNHIAEQGYAHLAYLLPPARTVVTVHDLMPLLRWRGEIPPLEAPRRPWLSELSVRALPRVARLIANSEQTKRDLVRALGCDPARIAVVYLGIDERYRPSEPETRRDARAELGLPPEPAPLVLVTGEAFYKNLASSLRVARRLQELCSVPPWLVHLGEASAEWQEGVRQNGLAARVIELAGLADAAMPSLYGAVDCLLFPSWYEGFGLPPLEAMACGTPVVCSNRGALPEAVGNAAALAAPDDVEGLARLVQAALEDRALRRERTALGLRQAARFTWAAAARGTLKVYREVMAGEGVRPC